ncbi:CYP714B2 [Symbiodinium natans]|uniref:CYP714B2 protein n=1 Tax=Symbiodinium natans TaxID=878477 RepID=A0A812M7X3_9DINO|nr:CYP714B2 [Symbiodinium natans]
MVTYRQYGQNFCASGEVWLGSHADVKKAVQNPQARTHWLGEHPLLPSSLPHGESGRCVFLLALSSKAVGGTGDHENFRKCVIDTLLGPASVARETDEISAQLMRECAEDFLKIDSGFDFYDGSEGGNQAFWIKYLHHVLFGMDIRDKVKPEYNNMTARELALLMTSIMRIAGVQGSRMLTWLLSSTRPCFVLHLGVIYGNLRIDARDVWDSLNLDDEDDVLNYILEVARLSPPVTVSHHVAMEDFSCDIAGKTYKFPKGTKVAIPLVFANIDATVWGEDVWPETQVVPFWFRFRV